jgi:hypothetical protein
MSSTSNRQILNASTAVGWLFNKRLPNGHQQDPDSHLHFKSADGRAAAALREAIQNILDALAKGMPFAFVRLALASLSRDAVQEVFGPSVDHWEACGIPAGQFLGEDIAKALVIEDFNTTGLTGSFLGTEPEDGAWASLVFWAGASGKEDWRGGRYGLGKTALMIASRLRVFAALTVREGEATPYFIAKAMLKCHKVDGVKYQGWGYFTKGLYQGIGPEMPFEGAEAERLESLLGTTRKSEPGTSIIIPFPGTDLTAETGLVAVLSNFGHQIARGKLQVDAFGEMLEATNVQAVAARVLPPGDLAHNRIRLALAMADATMPRFVVTATRKSDTEVEARDVQDLPGLKAAWLSGRPFLIEATFPFEGEPEGVDILYVVEPTRDDVSLDARAPFFVRSGVSVQLKTHATSACFHSGEVCSRRASGFFARAENPAHDKWTATDAPSYHVYTQATSLVRCLEDLCAPPCKEWKVRSAFDGFFRVPMPQRQTTDQILLGNVSRNGCPVDWGNVDEPAPPALLGQNDPGEPFVFPENTGTTTDATPAFSYGYEDGSFVMRGHVPEGALKSEIVLSLGYKVNRQRKGIKKHTASDFDLTDEKAHAVEADGAIQRQRGANYIVFSPIESRVSMKLRGFDPNRALDYHVSFRALEVSTNA